MLNKCALQGFFIRIAATDDATSSSGEEDAADSAAFEAGKETAM